MPKFELEKLTSYDDESLLAEMRRVAALIPTGKLKSSDFNKLSKVHSSTVHRRFGNWAKALAAAGMPERFENISEAYSKEEIIGYLKSVAAKTGRNHVTFEELTQQSGVTSRPVHRLFGSYKKALEAAGLDQSPRAARYTDEECFENLLNVWTALGRQPAYDEINKPPSRVGSHAYTGRWGSWRKSLAAFVDRINQDTVSATAVSEEVAPSPINKPQLKRTPRSIPLGLRYTILKRDRFRCVLCGKSPATDHVTILHVDHYKAWSQGGETILENLRSLCSYCNLGKGAKSEIADA